MRKLLLVSVALLLVSGLALADAVYGTLGTPASHNVTVNVTIPPRVGINIDAAEHVKALDLTGDATYPPMAAAYWAVGTNLISIISTGNYSYAYSTNATGLLAGLTLGEFEYQGNAWAPQAGAGWHAFQANESLTNTTGRTAGWVTRNLDYRVSLDGGETAGVNTLVITYTMTAQP
jgi:hypothetical protein